MNEIDLVQSLIEVASQLPHRDEVKLDALRRRADLIIRRVFGDSSKYLNDLANIRFFPMFARAKEQDYNESWLSGQSRMLNLFNILLEELKLFGKSQKVNEAQKVKLEFSNRVFVVHGRDEAMKHAVARTLEKIGIETVILHEQPNKGRTIIEIVHRLFRCFFCRGSSFA
jgi:hypothetical protein